jgi:hypothetical protein
MQTTANVLSAVVDYIDSRLSKRQSNVRARGAFIFVNAGNSELLDVDPGSSHMEELKSAISDVRNCSICGQLHYWDINKAAASTMTVGNRIFNSRY